MNQLNESLSDWTDLDIAMHILAIELGLLNKDELFSSWKGMYYTVSKVGDALSDILDRLVSINYLEYDEDRLRIRKNKSFKILINGRYEK